MLLGTLVKLGASFGAGLGCQSKSLCLEGLMRPYFQTELGDLYQSDAIQLLRTFKTGSARLVVADPPYGIGKAEWDTFEDRQRYVEWSLSWIKEAARVLDDRGTLYMMGFPEILADVKFLASEHFEGCRWLVWYYRNKANLGRN